MKTEIKCVDTDYEIIQVKKLLKEYSFFLLNFGSVFENYVSEIENLKEYYKFGKILVLKLENEIIGCGCLLRLEKEICELKRMFIIEKHRNKGFGKIFLTEIINIASKYNYKIIKLDTLGRMKSANILYKSFGFKEIKPYKTKLIDEMYFFELNLQ